MVQRALPIPLALGLRDLKDWVTRSSVISRFAYPLGRVFAALGDSERALSLVSRAHRMARVPAIRERCERHLEELLPVSHAAPTERTQPLEPILGRRMLVLKAPKNGERGVLFVMFSELLAALAAQVDVPRLLADYTLVLEPSWSGYFDRDLLYYTQFDDPIFVLSGEPGDFTFLEKLDSNLVPVPLGSCDWVDPSVAEPYLGQPKEFDLVMNSHWGPSKRHHVLFRALMELDPTYRVALIGGPWEGGTRDDIERLAEHFGVLSQISFFERIPFEEVMNVTCRARCSVLLSLKEGSNRALPESMFCDVPVISLDDNVGGIHKNIVDETGRVVPEKHLARTIAEMARGEENTFQPRAWALENRSCLVSGDKMNRLLAESARERGQPWTQDLAHHANSPEPVYLDAADRERLADANEGLRRYMKPLPS